MEQITDRSATRRDSGWAAVTTEPVPGGVVVRVRPALSADSTELLAQTVSVVLERHPRSVIVDLREAALGLDCIKLLIDASTSAERNGIHLLISGMPEPWEQRLPALDPDRRLVCVPTEAGHADPWPYGDEGFPGDPLVARSQE